MARCPPQNTSVLTQTHLARSMDSRMISKQWVENHTAAAYMVRWTWPGSETKNEVYQPPKYNSSGCILALIFGQSQMSPMSGTHWQRCWICDPVTLTDFAVMKAAIIIMEKDTDRVIIQRTTRMRDLMTLVKKIWKHEFKPSNHSMEPLNTHYTSLFNIQMTVSLQYIYVLQRRKPAQTPDCTMVQDTFEG